jgi:hypothetical protein
LLIGILKLRQKMDLRKKITGKEQTHPYIKSEKG